MKLSSASVVALALGLLAAQTGAATAAAAEAKAGIFPSLRKRLQEEKKKVKAAEEAKAADVPQVQVVAAAATAPVEVPAPVDANNAGFPELPEVSAMLGEASATLKSVNSQASVLEARVVQAQMASEAKMAKQKAAFEQKLKSQEEGNRAVIAVNSNISAQIEELKQGNDALRKHANQLQQGNTVMRSELHALENKLSTGREYVAKSLGSTDDSQAKELAVLQLPHAPRRHLRSVKAASDSDQDSDEDDDQSDDDQGDEDTSFLAVSMKVHRTHEEVSTSAFDTALAEFENALPGSGSATPTSAAAGHPSELLDVLSKSVAQLSQQEKESEKQLKALFVKDFRAGARRHAALIAQQKHLNSTRGSLIDLQHKLKVADKHLEGTRGMLEQKLHSIGRYMQKLAHLALSPTREVPHLLKALPQAVAPAKEGAQKVEKPVGA